MVNIQKKRDQFYLRCSRNQYDVINVRTDKDYVDPLMNYYRKREKRY